MYGKKIAITLLLGISCTALQAQYLQDIYRFSQPDRGATARFKALGNAQTALGGDLSSIAGNPAGLGFFSQSDIGLSIDYVNDANNSTYFGENSRYNVDKFGFNQIGIVLHNPIHRARGSNLTEGWLNFNIGISYNKTNTFNSTVGFSGINSENSISDFMAYEAYTQGNIYGDFGWDAGLIDQRPVNGQYEYVAMTMLDNAQRITNRETGYQAETNISFGANYSNRLYIGAGLGFARINHDVNYLFREEGTMETYGYIFSMNPRSRFVDNTNTEYDVYNPLLESDYVYENEYWSTTSGNGFNAKLGLIYKPVQYFQLGISAVSPTWYRLRNDYEDYFGITNYLTDGGTSDFESEGEPTYFDYRYRSPYRINGGVAAIFEQGLISVDVEYVDYAGMYFSSIDSQTDENMNRQIRDTFTGATNFRIGGEYMLAPELLVRLGYGQTGSPYRNADLTTQTVSFGLGYRINNVYIDLAYQHLQQKYGWQVYELDDANEHYSPVADIRNTRHNLFLTLGWKF